VEAWDEDAPPYYTFWFPRPDSTPTVLRRNWDWRPTREHPDRLALDWETQRLTWRTTGDWTDWVTEEMKEGGTPGVTTAYYTDDRAVVNLDGATELLRDTRGTTIGTIKQFSIEIWNQWIYSVDSYTKELSMIAAVWAPGKLYSVIMYWTSNYHAQLTLQLGFGEKSFQFNSTPWIEGSKTWYHHVITFDGLKTDKYGKIGELLFYQRGVLQEPASPTSSDLVVTSPTNDFRVALGGDVTGSQFSNGNYYSCSTWSSVLSPTEVAALYNNKVPLDPTKDSPGLGYTSSANLTHWCKLGHDISNIGKDYAPGGTLDLMNNAVNIDATDVEPGWPGE